MLIEDDQDDIALFNDLLAEPSSNHSLFGDVQLVSFRKVDEAKQYLHENSDIDIILLDLFLPDSSGIETLQKFCNENFEVPVVVLTILNEEHIITQALQNGAQDYLIKGQFHTDLLLRTIRYSIERHKWINLLRNLALIDTLTGLYNRRGFLMLAESHLKLAKRKEKGAILFFIDMDNLKSINDRIGHREGDNSLLDVAHVLKVTFRASDIIGRYGGDEFVVLALEASNEDLDSILKRLEENIENHNARESNPYVLSISYGFSCFDPYSATSIKEMLERADESMYGNKKKKREGSV